MVLALAWWAWVALVVIGGAVVAFAAMATYRRGVRREFVAFLREHHPQFQVVSEHSNHLVLRQGEAEGQLYLHKLYDAVASSRADSAEARASVFRHFADSLLKGTDEYTNPLNLNDHGPRVLPRLVTQRTLDAMPDAALIPRRPLGETGLFVVYVLDSEDRVMYLTSDHVADLGLGPDALHGLALSNLEKTFSPKMVRDVIENNNLVAVKCLDSYDAARLLLVPRHLKPGEAVAAVVPDRDTLTLVPLPAGRDLSELRPLARVPLNTDHLLLDRPLRVTAEGFSLV